MSKNITRKYVADVLVDKREKPGYQWEIPKKIGLMTKATLDTGDYVFKSTRRGGPVITVEKKGGWEEFLQNIAMRDRKRFEATLYRLSDCPNPLFVIEDDLRTLKGKLNISPTVRIEMYNVLYWLNEITMTHGIPIIYLGHRSQSYYNLRMKTFMEHIYRRMI